MARANGGRCIHVSATLGTSYRVSLSPPFLLNLSSRQSHRQGPREPVLCLLGNHKNVLPLIEKLRHIANGFSLAFEILADFKLYAFYL